MGLAYVLMGQLGALVPVGAPGVSPKSLGGGDDGVEVMLVSGSLHYDFLLPATPATLAAFEFAQTAGVPLRNPGVEWLVLGWGAEMFYTTTGTYRDVGPGAVWRAITGDRAVVRLDAIGRLHPDAPLTRLVLSKAQYRDLLDSLAADFSNTSFGAAEPLDLPGFTPTDRFFRANGHFSAARTCNVWVGEKLRDAGVAFGVWTPTVWSVDLALRTHTGA